MRAGRVRVRVRVRVDHGAYLEDLTRSDLAKPREDELQVIVRGKRVQLTHKENVAIGFDLSVWDIAENLEHFSTGTRLISK